VSTVLADSTVQSHPLVEMKIPSVGEWNGLYTPNKRIKITHGKKTRPKFQERKKKRFCEFNFNDDFRRAEIISASNAPCLHFFKMDLVYVSRLRRATGGGVDPAPCHFLIPSGRYHSGLK